MSQRTAEEIFSVFGRIFGGRRDCFALYSKTMDGEVLCRRSCRSCGKGVFGCGCDNCAGGKYISFGAENLIDHLNGKTAVGIYPADENGFCRFSVLSVEGEAFAPRLKALSEACERLGLACLREISEFGTAARLWIIYFRDKSVNEAAKTAKKVVSVAAESDLSIFEALEHALPVPAEKLGASVMLPLYNLKSGYSFFLDENMQPVAHPLEYLENIKSPAARIDCGEEAEKEKEIRGELCGKMYIPLGEISSKTAAAICAEATVLNPSFANAKGQKSFLRCWEICAGRLVLPPKIDISSFARKIKITRRTTESPKIKLNLKIGLGPWQEWVKKSLIKGNGGIVAAPVGSGKTEAVCAVIAHRKAATLILVPDKTTALRWKNRLSRIFNLDENFVRVVAESRDYPNAAADVAVIGPDTELWLAEYAGRYSTVVVADCDRILCDAKVFQSLMDSVGGDFVCGLCAKDVRETKLCSLLELYVGKQIN